MLSVAKNIVPAPLFGLVRSVLCPCVTPFMFGITTGHAKSAFRRRAVDRSGQPIPWLTYPAIDLLREKDLSSRRVLEFGAGQSTLWWSRRVREVISFEDGLEWQAYVTDRAPSNARVYLVKGSTDEITEILEKQDPFDIVLVDGFDRAAVSAIAKNVVKPDGVVILDNSEGFWGREGTYPIMDMYRAAGFQRVDFFGFAPAMFRPHCTSMFFRQRCFLFKGTENPPRTPA